MPAFLRLPAGSMQMPASWWWKSALAGACGGGALWLFQALVAIVGHGDGWAFVNRVAAVFPGWNPVAVGMVGGPTTSGAFLHLAIAAVVGLIFGLVIDFMPALLSSYGMAIVSGAVMGFWTWVVIGRTIAPILSVGFRAYPQVEFLVAHTCFGAVTTFILYLLAERKELAKVRVTMYPAERAVTPAGGEERTTTI